MRRPKSPIAISKKKSSGVEEKFTVVYSARALKPGDLVRPINEGDAYPQVGIVIGVSYGSNTADVLYSTGLRREHPAQLVKVGEDLDQLVNVVKRYLYGNIPYASINRRK